MGERELTVEYKGDSDPELDRALRTAVRVFGYELIEKEYSPKSRVRELRFLRVE